MQVEGTKTMKIITNYQPRNTLYYYELTPKERKEFDYLDTPEKQDDTVFFRYKNNTYDLNEFMRTPKDTEISGWDGYHGDSYFSGILVKWVKNTDYEQVIVGLYLS